MKISKSIIAFSLIVASASSAVVFAKENDFKRQHDKPGAPIMQMLKGLELSPNQREQIQQLVQQQRAEGNRHDGPKVEMAKMKALMQAEQFDEAAVRALLEQHQQQRLEQELSKLKLQHDIRQLLTTEQREQLDKKRELNRDKHRPDA